MDLYAAMEGRRSIRAYQPDEVPEASLARILRAAQIAPSWKNRQAWHIITVTDRAMIERVGQVIGNNPRGVDYHTVPMLLVLAMDPTAVEVYDGKEYYLVDAGIVGEHIMLAAQAEGLGACWVGWFEDAPVKEALGVPDPMRLVMLTPLGFPAQAPSPRPRKAVEDIVHRERW